MLFADLCDHFCCLIPVSQVIVSTAVLAELGYCYIRLKYSMSLVIHWILASNHNKIPSVNLELYRRLHLHAN